MKIGKCVALLVAAGLTTASVAACGPSRVAQTHSSSPALTKWSNWSQSYDLDIHAIEASGLVVQQDMETIQAKNASKFDFDLKEFDQHLARVEKMPRSGVSGPDGGWSAAVAGYHNENVAAHAWAKSPSHDNLVAVQKFHGQAQDGIARMLEQARNL